jgi:hypothetical protein
MMNIDNTETRGIRFCDRKHILRRTNALASERLAFRDGTMLGDVDIRNEKGSTVRKVRRIIEKRVCQHLYRNNKGASAGDNYGRYNERHRITNSLKNLYGWNYIV